MARSHRKIFTIINSFLFLFLLSSIVVAQDSLDILVFPSAKNISYNLSCSITNEHEANRYNYSIQTLTTSQQDIDFFILEIFSDILKVSSPTGWHGGHYKVTKETVKWFASDTTKRIAPKELLEGFELNSRGLPTIVNSYCRGSVPFPVVTEDPDSIVGDNLYENSVIKKTIAPKTIPNPFDPLAFVDSMIEMGDEADTLGWIGKPEQDYQVWNILKGKLNKVHSYIENENYNHANEELNSFLTAVEDYYKGKTKNLTNEGYALMKYNGEYLIKHIRTLGK